jgi:hypothetical protein
MVAVAAAIFMPLNSRWEYFVTDPQFEQLSTINHDALAMKYTSGFVAGTMLSLAFGAAFWIESVRLLPRGTGRPAVAPLLAWAAGGGAVLAAVNAVAAFLLAGPSLHASAGAGTGYEVFLFQSDGPWRVVAAWAALFPVAAVLGSGFGALLSRSTEDTTGDPGRA